MLRISLEFHVKPSRMNLTLQFLGLLLEEWRREVGKVSCWATPIAMNISFVVSPSVSRALMCFYSVIHVGRLGFNVGTCLLPSPRKGLFKKINESYSGSPYPAVLRIYMAIALRRTDGNADFVNFYSHEILAIGQAPNYSESVLVLLKLG